MQAMIRNVNETEWREAALSLGDEADLLSLWGDDDSVRMALGFKEPRAVFVLALKCRDGRFPSIAAMFPAASRLERTICDLYGHIAEGARDLRPWLDHGRWPLESPLGAATAHDGGGAAYPFLGAEGDGLHQIPVGPVHAGIIEPGHFRFHASGETVVRLEERLGTAAWTGSCAAPTSPPRRASPRASAAIPPSPTAGRSPARSSRRTASAFRPGSTIYAP